MAICSVCATFLPFASQWRVLKPTNGGSRILARARRVESWEGDNWTWFVELDWSQLSSLTLAALFAQTARSPPSLSFAHKSMDGNKIMNIRCKGRASTGPAGQLSWAEPSRAELSWGDSHWRRRAGGNRLGGRELAHLAASCVRARQFQAGWPVDFSWVESLFSESGRIWIQPWGGWRKFIQNKRQIHSFRAHLLPGAVTLWVAVASNR